MNEPRFRSGDEVVLLRGSEPAVILRQVRDDRFGHRYSVRYTNGGRTATARELDMKYPTETWEQRWSA